MRLWLLGGVYSALRDPLVGFEVGCKMRRKEKGKTEGREKEEKKGTGWRKTTQNKYLVMALATNQ